MWTEIIRLLPNFPGAVLTGVDAEGYPFSVRCHPEPDPARDALHVYLPPGAPIQPGPAGLLCHRHDVNLWNLKSFSVRGALEHDAEGWLFRPKQFIPGMGIGGVMGYVNFVRNGRRNTVKYLKARGLARPRISWEEIREMMSKANEDDSPA